ncbi:MAG: alpha-D-glucose phosphate-specific phosphoglucomutase, partial [Deltaproteobacteria bacterium]|nr:alpha-D-glucose phosphate-specific phosphoglucomutase [Deltaproteobacteria bacterium]
MAGKIHELAGRTAPESILTDVDKLEYAYYNEDIQGPVAFGTSGHRGTSISGTFNDAHIAATSQAICEYRVLKGITGPLFLGFDPHALSGPAFKTAVEVFAANDVETVIHANNQYTPTPVISFFILDHNRNNEKKADGVVVTPSHNPPEDGGFKYNPPSGGPADVDVTSWIQDRANEIIVNGGKEVKRSPYEKAIKSDTVHQKDFIGPFVQELSQIVDMGLIKDAGIKIGADPMGGSGVGFWEPIADFYGLDIDVVNKNTDPTFRFMTLDSDGKIRMDCSSPYAMASLIAMSDKYDIAWGNDPDFDRHGIVCPDGLMNPNHYLSVAIWYLLKNRPGWNKDISIGKTLVSSSMIDMIVKAGGKKLYEVPVGFKWFVQGLLDGSVAFGGEESAGASFLRMDGSTWTTDKDGFCMTLLAAEILAKTGRCPSGIYKGILIPEHGESFYKREDGPISDGQKAALKALKPENIKSAYLAGKKMDKIMTHAPGNNASIGGVKVTLEGGSWFAIRPSGTEPKMKVYIESFEGEGLWQRIYDEALPLIF